MRDIPMFTTENGVASLVLKEIPYKGIAYITIQDSLRPAELLKECIDFCKMAGAEKIYATGDPVLLEYPIYTTVVKMQQLKSNLSEGDGCLFPVTEETSEQWRGIYNEKMRHVPDAVTIARGKMKEYVAEGCCYFVHKDDELLGIGMVKEERLEAIATCQSGAGETVLLTLCNIIFTENVVVEVAINNQPAIKLYERLGFRKIAEVSSWYVVCE